MKSKDSIFHPGITVNELIEDRGMTPSDLAAASGLPEADILAIFHCEKDITAPDAEGLEKALVIGAYYWLALQEHYSQELSDWKECMQDRKEG